MIVKYCCKQLYHMQSDSVCRAVSGAGAVAWIKPGAQPLDHAQGRCSADPFIDEKGTGLLIRGALQGGP